MKVRNVHERTIAAPAARVAALVADLNRIWPTQIGPAPQSRENRIYRAGLMTWEEFDRPGATRAFRVVEPVELRIEHWFELEPGASATILRHTVEGSVASSYEAIWRERIFADHDLTLEALFDNVQTLAAVYPSEQLNPDKMNGSVAVVLEIFRAVERRDGEALRALCDPAVEFIWPSSLPYGGEGLAGLAESGAAFQAAWDDFQTETERQMDPVVVAASQDEVVVCWQQKGVDCAGRRLQTPVLGRYRVRNGKLARAHMFYFDTIEVADFLANARRSALQ